MANKITININQMKQTTLILFTLSGLLTFSNLFAQLNFENFQKVSAISGNLGVSLAAGASLGSRIANIGDLDGDGIPDIAIASPGDNDGGPTRGAMYILFMKNDGTVKKVQKISNSSGNLGVSLADNDRFGYSMATLGDLDGDGVQDLVVGCIGHNGYVGCAYILFMKKDGTVKSHTVIDGNTANFSYPTASYFSHHVACPGDIDGDGIPDIAIGAIMDNDGGSPYGAVYILFMKRDGTVKGFQKISETQGNLGVSLSSGCYFGYSLCKSGDLNGDETPDLIVSAPEMAVSSNPTGAVFILYLKPDGTVKSHKQIDYSTKNFQNILQANESFGTSVQMIEDVNGDGIKDLLVGAEHFNLNVNDKGTVYVFDLDSFQGVKSYQRIGASTSSSLDAEVQSGSCFGISVIDLNNFNSSYTHTIAVGAFADNDGNSKAGAMYVIFLKAHTSGINGNAQIFNTYQIYPNPLKEILNIAFNTEGERTIELINPTGKILLKKHFPGETFTLSLSDFPKGIYFVRVSDSNSVSTEKVLKL